MRSIKGIISAFMCAVLLAGCGQSQPETDPEAVHVPEASATEEPATPSAGGELRVGMRMPSTLNPLLNEDATVDSVLRLVFEPLMELDGSLRPVNGLAANVNFASDGLSVVITLKDGLRWADGEQITARDVEHSVNVLRNGPERGIYAENVRNISEVVVADDLNIKLNYIQSFGGAAYMLCFPIIPRHFTGDWLNETLGSGLYEVSGFDDREGLVLTASKNAYGEAPYISQVRAIITSDFETDISSFEQGLTDLVYANVSDWGNVLNPGDVRSYPRHTTYFDFIGFNFAKDIFADIRTRQAVAHSIDKDKLLSDVYFDGSKVNAPIDAESWLFEEQTVSYGFDPDKAKDLFAETGLGILRILVNEENEERVRIAQVLQENLLAADVEATIESVPFPEYETMLQGGDFDLVVAGFYLSVAPELTFAFGTGADMNYFAYSNETMDALLSEFFTAPGTAAYIKAAGDLQKFFAEELPCVSLVFRKSSILVSDRVEGVSNPTISNPFTGIKDWFIADKGEL